MTYTPTEPTTKLDHLSILAAVEVCDRFFLSLDALDWDAFEDYLADEVTTDFTDLWGGEPETAGRSQLRAAWTFLFAGFASTQHLISNYVPEPIGDDGTTVWLCAAFRSIHFGHDPYGSPTWTLYGRYRIELVTDGTSFRIKGLHQTATAGEGNRNILLLAAARTAD